MHVCDILNDCLYYLYLLIHFFSELYQAVRQTVEYVKEQLKSYKGGGKLPNFKDTIYILRERERMKKYVRNNERQNIHEQSNEITKDIICIANFYFFICFDSLNTYKHTPTKKHTKIFL